MIRNHSHYSLLISTSRSSQIVESCKNFGYSHAGITDIMSVSGCVNFIQQCKKQNISPIIGCDIVLTQGDRITLICKNKSAWYDLLKIVSKANDESSPSISLQYIIEEINCENFIVIDGYLNSRLFYTIFSDTDCILNNIDQDSLLECLSKSYISDCKQHIEEMQHIFGTDYYIEMPQDLSSSFPVYKIMSMVLDELNISQSILIPNTSSYYPEQDDRFDHRILLCSKLKTTLKRLEEKIKQTKNIELLSFIYSSNHHIKSIEVNDALQRLLNSIENFEILSKPKLPKFETPDNISEIEYLKELCRQGWREKLSPIIDEINVDEYKERALEEFATIEKANLSGYFLIVQDYVNHFRKQGCLIGPGRGSGGGSLLCYLLGITLIDPIKYGLLFSRFYNEGRNTKDHISLPDIDIDFPPSWRDKAIAYAKEKYGDDKVCQMITFGKLAGKSILKEILRAKESCSFDEMNIITSKIPNEASISDLLEEMENPSVIQWALQNDLVSDYCWINQEGGLEGDYAKDFEQALRMEGIFKTQGKHAAGVVISSDEIEKMCPIVKSSRGSDRLGGFEMGDFEDVGGVKFDILGVSCLEKIANTVEEINYEL